MILILNHGHFMYTLDDPYIHLSLSENISISVYSSTKYNQVLLCLFLREFCASGTNFFLFAMWEVGLSDPFILS